MQSLKSYLQERSLSPSEKGKAEKIVKGMKKAKSGFTARYGPKAKSVMYATATKLAKEEVQVDESFMSTYNRNENANRHTANIVHLAKHFGDEADKSQAKFYADELKKHGHNIHHEAQYKLHMKLWPKAVAAHQGIKEDVQLDEMQLKGINVTASRYHPGKTRVTDLDHRMRDKQPRTSERTSVKNFMKAILKLKSGDKKLAKEDVQLDELKSSTLGSYIKTAVGDLQHQSRINTVQGPSRGNKYRHLVGRRRKGIEQATNRLVNKVWGLSKGKK